MKALYSKAWTVEQGDLGIVVSKQREAMKRRELIVYSDYTFLTVIEFGGSRL